MSAPAPPATDPAPTAAPGNLGGPRPTPLLQVRNLKTYFPVKRGLLKSHVGDVRAVDDVSFDVFEGESLGLVGESGCGKSTVGRSLLRLIPATAGRVHFRGEDVFTASRDRMRQLRREMQIIFQDPVGSLNPRMTVGRIVGEPMGVHRLHPRSEIPDRVRELLVKVGLQRDHADRYPHEFSGGQRQRIGIARALSLGPAFIVCDEPVSEHFCDRIAVMYLGRIVELADRDTLYRNPQHPYTRALLSAAPMPDPDAQRRRIVLEGDVPSPIHLFKTAANPAATAADTAATERQPGVEYVTRQRLLHRPDLVEVSPGHFVSPPPADG